MRPFAAIGIAAAVLLGAAGCDSGPSAPTGHATPETTIEAGAPRARAPARPKLLLAGEGEIWVVDVRSERTRHYVTPELPGGDPPHRVVRRGSRFVLEGAGTFVAGPRISHRRPLRPIDRSAAFFLPSADPDRVWLFKAGATAIRFAAAREITATGRQTVAAARPPPGWPERAARSGILFSQSDPTLVLWNPRTRTVVNRLPASRIGDIGPVHGDTLASCQSSCRTLRLTDVRTGAQRRFTAPHGLAFEPYNGSFSSTGGEFAVPVAPPGSHGARRLAIVKLDHLAMKLVRRSRVPQGYVMAEWSRDDRHVFLAGGHRGTAVIVDYDRSRNRVLRLRPTASAFYDMAAR